MRGLLKIVLGALAIGASAGLAEAASPERSPRVEISDDGRSVIYDGEVVRLSRDYSSSYEDYQQDPNNIDPTENAHVERLMTQARLPKRFADREEAFSTVLELKFPGYGSRSLQARASTGQREWRVLVFEIPRAGKSRYVAIAEGAAGWSVIDDFVADDRLGLSFAERGDGAITYSDGMNRKLLVHQDRDDSGN